MFNAVEFTISVGISYFHVTADTCFKNVFSRADAMMYLHKHAHYRVFRLSCRD